MQRILSVVVASGWLTYAAAAQTPSPSATSKADFLSLDQKERISQLITKQDAPLTNPSSFSIAVDSVVPAHVQIRSLPSDAEQLAPQIRGYGYVVIEEQIALVDLRTRKVEIVFPRWRQP
jgi:hypothetical protein